MSELEKIEEAIASRQLWGDWGFGWVWPVRVGEAAERWTGSDISSRRRWLRLEDAPVSLEIGDTVSSRPHALHGREVIRRIRLDFTIDVEIDEDGDVVDARGVAEWFWEEFSLEFERHGWGRVERELLVAGAAGRFREVHDARGRAP